MTEDAHRRFLALMAVPAYEQEAKAMLQAIAEQISASESLTPEELEELRTSILSAIPPSPVRRLPLRRWMAAASILLLLGAGIYLWTFRRQAALPEIAASASIDAAPGRNGAILTLSDGTQLQLDTARNGIVALQHGAAAKLLNGRLIYEGHTTNTVYNTMTTPKGRQFELTLPDGSKVWLNAASSIHYPVAFKSAERKVKIRGEAYFEISKDEKKPFIVDVDGKQTVQVLGTAFNINSYADEHFIATTLLQGSIRVNDMLLAPGQQALLQKNLQVKNNVDTAQVIAWKNGVFNFTDMDVTAAFRQISRWYDIDVRFEGQSPAGKFRGKISRDLPLAELLELLKKFNLRFRMEEKTLIVISAK